MSLKKQCTYSVNCNINIKLNDAGVLKQFVLKKIC